jgi:hypothetical protein
MTNEKFSMTNSQFRPSALVAASPRYGLASWRLCVGKSFLSVESAKSVVQFIWLRLAALGLGDFAMKGPFYPWNRSNPWFNSFVSDFAALGSPCPVRESRAAITNRAQSTTKAQTCKARLCIAGLDVDVFGDQMFSQLPSVMGQSMAP